MKFNIDSKVLAKYDLTVSDYVILLYYYLGNVKFDPDIPKKLHEKGYLIKDTDGKYIADRYSLDQILSMSDESSNSLKTRDRCINLAKQLIELYPKGKKPGTKYYWTDGVVTIAGKLNTFFKKYDNPENPFTDEQIINATRKYIETYIDDTRYMQLLRYFINKRDINTGEENSQLASFIENDGVEEVESDFFDLV